MTTGPELVIEHYSKELIRFRLKNTNAAFANTLRRVVIAHVPTLAVEFVHVYENTSPLCDEQIAHWLGLIPMNSHLVDKFNYPEVCICSEQYDTCPLCSIKFELNKENKSNEPLIITTKDLVLVDVNDPAQRSVQPVSQYVNINGQQLQRDIELIRLGQNQKIHLECIVKKGKGIQHTKWSPVAVCAMRYDPIVELNEAVESKLSQKQKESLIQICPRKVFSFSKQKNHLEVTRAQDCIFCYECKGLEKSMEIEDLIKIQDGDFIFEIESIGSLSPDEIVASAFQQIDIMLNRFQQDIEAINYSTMH